MKLPILGDTHWGCRSDSPIFYKHFEKFYSTQFIPALQERKLKTLVQVGDLFDVRKKTNSLTLTESQRIFFDPLHEAGIQIYVIVGNHDAYLKESIKINTPRLLLSEVYDNVHVIDTPTTVKFDGVDTDMIPWICEENEEEILAFIKASKSKLCVGHFEPQGFAMYRGMEAAQGIDPSIFNRYLRVFSGHYHTRSTVGNFHMVGTPYEMTWHDSGDPKGYHIYDTKTDDLEFCENPDKIFVKLEYDDTAGKVQLTEDLTDKFVKVVVTNKTDPKKFDSFIQSVSGKSFYDLKIADDMSEFVQGSVNADDVTIKDTVSVMEAYIDSIETALDKTAIKSFMKGLYVEAINQEEA